VCSYFFVNYSREFFVLLHQPTWTTGDQVWNLVSDDKWAKTKSHVTELRDMLEKDSNCLQRERLESIRGFLMHVAATYRGIKSYLNSLHFTIDGWRPNRNSGGWRIRKWLKPRESYIAKHEDSTKQSFRQACNSESRAQAQQGCKHPPRTY
jgi:hypothetical protein